MFEAEDWANLNALIVSEDCGFRTVIRANCERIGLRDVDEAKNGAEAFNLIATKPYSVLLVHGQLHPSGTKFVEVLRKNGERIMGGGDVPVVIVANEGATREMVFEAADVHANYLLQLPISAKGLMKGLHIAITQPEAFGARANAVRS